MKDNPATRQRMKVSEDAARSMLHLPITEAARELNCSPKTLYKCERAYGIQFGRATKRIDIRPGLEVFAEAASRMSVSGMAEYFGVAKSTILTWRKVYNVNPLPATEAGFPPLEGQRSVQASMDWIRKPLGRPFGGVGWYHVAGVEMARAEA